MDKEKLIRKLFVGLCNRQELEQLFDLLREEDIIENASVWAELWNQLGDPKAIDVNSTDRIYQSLRRKIHIGRDSSKIAMVKRRRFILSSAAAITVLMAAILWFFVANLTIEDISVRTTYGEKTKTELPDGSAVTLNANSELLYSAKWQAGEERTVQLSGEAFFEVEKKVETSQKFKVITDQVIIEVLGTSFNVNVENLVTSIYLQEGQIALTMPGGKVRQITMSPGNLVRYDHSTGTMTKVSDLARRHVSWKDGYVFFERASLREVCEKLSRLYGIEYQLSDSLAKEQITTGLPIDNLDLALEIVEITKNLRLIKTDSKISFTQKKSEPPSN